MKNTLTSILGNIVTIYFMVSILIFVPYYNWQYAKNHGFTEWLFFGEITATANAMIWPYDTFIQPNNEQRELDVITPQILDKVVEAINNNVPLNGPNSITIVGASKGNNAIIYDTVVGNISTDNINNTKVIRFLQKLSSTKYNLCNQEAEGFYLSRGISLAWNYHDSQGNFIGTIKVTPQDCNKT